MITAIIITFFIGTLTGYVVAALMAVSSNADRAREEQERLDLAEYHSQGDVSYADYDRNTMESIDFVRGVTNELANQLTDILKDRLTYEDDTEKALENMI